jgi:hypothetical protein
MANPQWSRLGGTDLITFGKDIRHGEARAAGLHCHAAHRFAVVVLLGQAPEPGVHLVPSLEWVEASPPLTDRGYEGGRSVPEYGIEGFTLMADRASGRLVAVSYWESESDMQASEEATRESREAAAEAVGASGGPRVERYEVLLDMEK